MSTTITRRLSTLLAIGLLAAAGACLSGCYERVVGARGLGASTYDIHDSYQENSQLDDWVFGKRESGTSTRIVRPHD